MDNPKKKKLDSKRVSMQRHEINYCRRLARKLEIPFKFDCEVERNFLNKNVYKINQKEHKRLQHFGSQVLRIAKAFLKLSRGK